MTDQLRLPDAVEQAGSTPLDESPLRLLLVEDNPGDARLVEEAFRRQAMQDEAEWQYEIEQASRLEEAVAAIRSKPFDLALLDLGLPDSQGLETIRRIQAADALLPIVVLTGNEDHQNAMQAMQAGAEDYLIKGEFDGEMLTRAVRYSLERSRLAEIAEGEASANQRILSSLSAHIAVLDNQGVIQRTNQAWEQFGRENNGKPEGASIGASYLDVVEQAVEAGVEESQEALDCLTAVISGSSDFEEMEYPCHSPTEQRWFAMRVTPLKEAVQDGVVVAHENITERRLAELQLQRQRQELSTILANTPDIIARFDLEGRHLYMSPSIQQLTGNPPEFFLGKTDEELGLPPDRIELGKRARQQVIKTGEPLEVEYRVAADNGDGPAEDVFLAKLVPEFDDDDRLESFLMVARDVSELTAARQLAEAHERVLAAVSFTAQNLLMTRDWEGLVPEVLAKLGEAVEVDRTYLWRNQVDQDGQLLASQFSEWAARPELALQDNDDLRSAPYEALGFERWRGVLGSGANIHGPVSQFPEAEREFLSQQSIESLVVVPIFAEDEWWGFLGFDDVESARVWDETIIDSLTTAAASLGSAIASQRAHEELEQREQRFRSMVQNASDIITIVNADGIIAYESPALERVMGFKPEDLIGLNVFDPVHPEDKPEAEAQFKRLVKDPDARMIMDVRFRGADGELRTLEVIGSNLLDDPAMNGIVFNSRDISERRQAAEELKERELQYRLLAENSTDQIWQVDLRLNFTYTSPSVERLFGYTPAEYVGSNFSKHVEWPEYLRLAKTALRKMRKFPDVEPLILETKILAKDGTLVPVEVSAGPLEDDEGNLIGIQGTTRDIRERKQAEKALRESERQLEREHELFEMLTETSPTAITLLNKEGEIIFANSEAQKVLEIEKLEITNRGYNDPEWKIESFEGGALPDEELPFAQVMAKKEPIYDIRHAIKLPDGRRKLLSINMAPVFTEEGEVGSVVANILDITKRVEAEQRLKDSEENYRKLFSTIADGIVVVDADRKLTAVNPAFATMFGYKQEEMLGRTSEFLYATEEVYRAVGEKARRAHERGDVTIGYSDIRLITKDGQEFIGEIQADTLTDEQGNRVGNVGVFRDVTERMRTRQALQASEKRYRSLFSSIRDAILVADQDRNIVQCNPAFSEIFGYSEDEIRGKKTITLYQDPEEFERMGKEIQALRESGVGEQRTVNVKYRRKSGDVFPGETGVYPLRDQSGDQIGAIGLIRDVTERQRHQREQEAIARVAEALRQASRSEEMPPIILEQLVDLLSAGGAEMVLTNRRQDRLWVELGVGSWKQFTGLELDIPENISWQVMQTSEPFQSNDLQTVEGFTSAKHVKVDRAAIAVSMQAGEVPVGVLWVARPTSFNQTDIQLLKAISDMAGNAIRRASLHEETRLRAEQMSVVSLLGRDLAEKLDEFAIYERLVEGTKRLLPDINTVIIARYQSDQELFRCAYGEHEGEIVDVSQLEPVPLAPPGEGSQSEAVHTRQPVFKNELLEMAEEQPESIGGGGLRHSASGLYVPLIAEGQVLGVIQAQSDMKNRFSQLDGEIMAMMASTAAVALNNADLLRETQGSAIELAMAYDTTLEGWAKALELRDKETEGHTRRVTDLTVRLAARIGLPADQMVHVRRGALVHDIGKMGIPDNILLKPGKLTDDEWVIMRKHPQMAYNMLEQVDFLRPSLIIPLYHHERWNGSGYPEGLKGDEIPLEARVFAVIDVYDALSSDRPYRKAWPEEKVHNYLRENAGVEFDPEVVEAFFEMI